MILCAGLARWTGAVSSSPVQSRSPLRRWFTIACIFLQNYIYNFVIISNQDHLRVSTKADNLTSQPQESELPFVSASELRK